MERASKRGKIPQRDWPLIIKRYEDGETLASIARTYDCSPPAISYILSRNRGRDGIAEHSGPKESDAPQSASANGQPDNMAEPAPVQGDKETEQAAPGNGQAKATDAGDGSGCESERMDPSHAPNGAREPPADQIAVVTEGNGRLEKADNVLRGTDHGDARRPHGSVPRPVAFPPNDEARRTLHLSPSREAAFRPDLQVRGSQGSKGLEHPSRSPSEPEQNGLLRDSGATGQTQNTGQTQKPKDSTILLDQALRERVGEDIAAFLAAFDAALADDSIESRAGLRDATDRLLRAGARTRIELERLDARVPLSPREDHRSAAPAWRPR
jgi:hypothetical protein